MTHQIIIEEQGLRDGLQTLAVAIPIEKKLEWANAFIDAGIKRLQVASFVNPKYVPQMADAEALIEQLPNNDAVVFSALVLNKKGVERALDTNIKHLAISLSASNTHSLKNANKTIEEAKEDIAEAIDLALKNGVTVRAGVQCAFGCRYEGNISKAIVYDLVQHLVNTGAQEIALADSTGMANPLQIIDIVKHVKVITSGKPLALHLHNTENKGYANVFAALQAGVTSFDTAFGGLGGCPFIKNATGNIATEDTVNMLSQMGYATGVDINKIKEISKEMERILGNELPGLMYKII